MAQRDRSRPVARVDNENPKFIRAEPGSSCEIRPQAAIASTGSSTALGHILADEVDGKVRFLAPPSAWGSELEIECTTAANTERFSVNLKDKGTYQIDEDFRQKPAVTSVRAPLTGDLLAISHEEILRRGYMPRPDPERNPAAYARS